MTALLLLASARDSIADYVSALVTVYWIIILAYILVGWLEAFGARIPYSRATSAVIGFLRSASEPYLGLFRRILPPMGGIDFSPIVAILVLVFVGGIVSDAIRPG
jgi:uncharacterized protein YggT (Ycf19 family)